jgi:hypothetical protein
VRHVWSAALAVLATACNKEIVVGADPVGDASDASEDACAASSGNPDDAAADAGGLALLVVPWSTGFENKFTDWSEPPDGGYCYDLGSGASHTIVTSPVHSGQHAAAFTVDPALASPSQTRCVRQGVLPQSAYYGAWYYVPAAATTIGTWNLFHFQGAETPDAATENLWDVSLVNETDGAVAPSVYDFKRAQPHVIETPIPIATWFHLEVLLKRSDVSTGEFTVYLNGKPLLDLDGIETDDTRWGQWYVGNYATALLPSPSTVYVDDVTIETCGP